MNMGHPSCLVCEERKLAAGAHSENFWDEAGSGPDDKHQGLHFNLSKKPMTRHFGNHPNRSCENEERPVTSVLILLLRAGSRLAARDFAAISPWRMRPEAVLTPRPQLIATSESHGRA